MKRFRKLDGKRADFDRKVHTSSHEIPHEITHGRARGMEIKKPVKAGWPKKVNDKGGIKGAIIPPFFYLAEK